MGRRKRRCCRGVGLALNLLCGGLEWKRGMYCREHRQEDQRDRWGFLVEVNQEETIPVGCRFENSKIRSSVKPQARAVLPLRSVLLDHFWCLQ
jgi:hypothetical protein